MYVFQPSKLMSIDNFCTNQIHVKCLSHRSNVHHVYIWDRDFGHLGFVMGAKINLAYLVHRTSSSSPKQKLQGLGLFHQRGIIDISGHRPSSLEHITLLDDGLLDHTY